MRASFVAAMALLATLVLSAEARATTSVCTWVTLGVCDFGPTYNHLSGTPLDTTSTLVFNCTTVGSSVTLGMGAGLQGTETARVFNGSTDSYQIYTDSARTNYFGTTAGHTVVISSPVLGNNTVTYYCRIPNGQVIHTGGHHDDNNTTLTFGSTTLTGTSHEYMTVNGTCSVTVGTQLAFGTYDPTGANLSSPLYGTATIIVNCTSYLAWDLDLDQGLNPAGGNTNTHPLRQMASGAARLRYDLFRDAAHSIIWGYQALSDVSGTGTGADDTRTVYGSVLSGQTGTAAASYTDTVTITVSF
ncbi:MAG: spore coat U domain-containing protein [Myxococcota bacterium]|nr:spore coat U domain-containing protein [Myxococcota bacterium]